MPRIFKRAKIPPPIRAGPECQMRTMPNIDTIKLAVCGCVLFGACALEFAARTISFGSGEKLSIVYPLLCRWRPVRSEGGGVR